LVDEASVAADEIISGLKKEAEKEGRAVSEEILNQAILDCTQLEKKAEKTMASTVSIIVERIVKL
jgi:vacuolar-type H+-ATPase subunit H